MHTRTLPINYEMLLNHLLDHYFVDDVLESVTFSRIKATLDNHFTELFDPEANDPDQQLTSILFEHFSFNAPSIDHVVGEVTGAVVVRDEVIVKMPLIYFNLSTK